MKKAVKIIFKVLAAILGAVILILIAATINQSVRLPIEAKKYPAPGKMVEVNGHKMHVFAQGKGSVTLVFMSGWGTSCPTLDFKPLWSKLSKNYRIAVVERSGYGWSEVSGKSRDIDTVLAETRKALTLSGEKPPYVLVPHSMSGLEAIYWAKKYPGEVKAIIGLDPSIPQTYDGVKSPTLLQSSEQWLEYYAIRMGVPRFLPQICESNHTITSGSLSESDKDEFRAMFYKNIMTKDMMNESAMNVSNAKKVKNAGVPDVPMYFFISNGNQLGNPIWVKLHIDYVAKLKLGKYECLDCGHYVQDYKSAEIAKESQKFIDKVLNQGAK